ncbi:hypothetical protein GCM10009809_28190 [Isoptericola hypogeus]|uniref:Uncharacterized protein n=1 Tax=Isoptericola hypogeus TaxID=300179 RepID=A0ABP4VQE2_9MICO
MLVIEGTREVYGPRAAAGLPRRLVPAGRGECGSDRFVKTDERVKLQVKGTFTRG